MKKTPKQPPGISAINETKVKAAINVLYDAVSVAQAPASGQTKLLVTDSAVATDVSKNPSPVKPVDTTQAASRPQLAPADVSVIPKVYDLDSFSKRKIPAIDYGAHIFATDQASGFVILNGAKKHAGERLRNGIYIEKIAEDNVILSYNGVVFSLPAMKSWSYK
ncbi:MAG: general secretion pathway protein GspB [Cellvibrionaceae bacterium]|nr:general secretion pathway protein GspB [Cellvibrionaceae bacterium]